jgi:aryl sulfotransferase
MSGIVWLASYPKSGNTWFRVFLTNYLRDANEPASINALDDDPIASARGPFDTAVGYDSDELTWDEIDALRPEVYLHLAREATRTWYCKAHDAYTFLPDGRPLFPPEATACVLYFIRNPLDVAVSFAHHGGRDEVDTTIRNMAQDNNEFCGKRSVDAGQLRQRLLTWSQHATSWADAPGLRRLVLRFEDMKQDPETVFGEAVRFLGLPFDTARLQKALKFSSFDELRDQERQKGFREKVPRAKSFFRKGEVGSWRETLTPEQANRIVADHGDVMRRFGYLDADGRIVF